MFCDARDPPSFPLLRGSLSNPHRHQSARPPVILSRTLTLNVSVTACTGHTSLSQIGCDNRFLPLRCVMRSSTAAPGGAFPFPCVKPTCDGDGIAAKKPLSARRAFKTMRNKLLVQPKTNFKHSARSSIWQCNDAQPDTV